MSITRALNILNAVNHTSHYTVYTNMGRSDKQNVKQILMSHPNTDRSIVAAIIQVVVYVMRVCMGAVDEIYKI